MFKELLERARRGRTLAAVALCFGMSGVFAAPALAATVRATAMDGVSDHGLQDALEEDEEAAGERSGCDLRPYCDFPEGGPVMLPAGHDRVTVPFKADILCDRTLTGTLFFYLDDHLVFLLPFVDRDEPRCFDLDVTGLGYLNFGDSVELRVDVLDNRYQTKTSCSVTVVRACDTKPSCEVVGMARIPESDHVYVDCDIERGLGPEVCVLVDAYCDSSDRLRVRLKRYGNTIETKYVTDADGPTLVCFNVPGVCDYEDGAELSGYKIQVKDEDGSDRSDECEFTIVVHKPCDDRPACYFDDHACDDGPGDVRSEIMMGIYDVATGDILPVMELCARSRCEEDYNVARVELFARPPFMEPISHAKGHPGGRVCFETRANDVVEGGYAEGTYWAKFRCTDTGNGMSRIIKVGFRYTDPEPEPEPEPEALCAEDESGGDNNSFDDASDFAAGQCADEQGVSFEGTLDAPVFILGDVDYFNVTELTPGAVYTATIVGGENPDGGLTDTMLGWFTHEGVIAAMDDNGAENLVYSKIEFVADASGAATIAVAGHGDSDFDGKMDLSMSYDEFGFGEYVLSIVFEAPPIEPLVKRADFNDDGIVDTADLSVVIAEFGVTTVTPADLNGDGVVDTSDLGMLIGVFGSTN